MSKLRQDDADRRQQSRLGPDHSEALARGLQILVLFNDGRRSQSLSDLAKLVGLPRATVRRALLTLEALGYVEAEGRLFHLTPRVLRLAAAYLTSNAVSTLLQPACDRIAQAIGESCTAAVLEGGEVVMIARALPAQLVPAGVGIGYRLPAYCSALGRVLLAALPDDSLAAYLARTTLAPVTPQTLTQPRAVHAAILAARQEGFCFVDGEAEPGFRSIAVPLRKFDGTVIAALNIGARAAGRDDDGNLFAGARSGGSQSDGISDLVTLPDSDCPDQHLRRKHRCAVRRAGPTARSANGEVQSQVERPVHVGRRCVRD